MDSLTRQYLKGRFGDYYRRTNLPNPLSAKQREWAFIPFGEETRMNRHRSVLGYGDVQGMFEQETPRHAYFSAGLYDNPAANEMNEKGWREATLVFDIDADHLPDIDPEADGYGEMLARGKEELQKLLDFLREDFGFTNMKAVFSGGRGYHVHVNDEGVRELNQDARQKIVDYILATDIEPDNVVEMVSPDGMTKYRIDTDGGWEGRLHSQFMSELRRLNEMDEEEAVQYLTGYEGIGAKKAEAILKNLSIEEAADGFISPHPAFRGFAKQYVGQQIESLRAEIDEPVTTDLHRLIRVPGSLHGGTGLRVTEVGLDEIEDFDPLVDAVPDIFTDIEVSVEVEEGQTVSLGGETWDVPEGETTLPEHVAVFLMANDEATKLPE